MPGDGVGAPRRASAVGEGPHPPHHMLVVYLDPYFLGDPLFVPGLAKDLAARGAGLVLVHGSGERGERALESLGRFPEAVGGVWKADDAEGREAVERATRELNREIVHELNEAGVASIRATGADRGLLRQRGDGVVAGRTGWVADLARQGVAVVVAALVEGEGGAVEVDAARAAGALAEATGFSLVALTSRSVDGGEVTDPVGACPDAAAVERARQRSGAVHAGPRVTLRQPEGPTATWTAG